MKGVVTGHKAQSVQMRGDGYSKKTGWSGQTVTGRAVSQGQGQVAVLVGCFLEEIESIGERGWGQVPRHSISRPVVLGSWGSSPGLDFSPV
jgi:hypothetical protein